MGNLIKSNKLEMVVKDGKLHITIDLNINMTNVPQQSVEEKVDWIVPEFETTEKIKFGSNKGE